MLTPGEQPRRSMRSWRAAVARRVTYVIGRAAPGPDGRRQRHIEAAFRHELLIGAHRDDVLRLVDAKLRAARNEGH